MAGCVLLRGVRTGLAVVVGMIVIGGGEARGQCVAQKVVASDSSGGDFGQTSAATDQWLIVGAWRDGNAGSGAGSAYMFKSEGMKWIEKQKLLASDASPDDGFGEAVAISGEVAVVGVRGVGAAYVFRFNGSNWIEEQKLAVAGSGVSSGFGMPVAIDGNTVIVGACGDESSGIPAGAAYVFEHNGSSWIESQTLIASDYSAASNFGRDIALEGNNLLIGAYKDDASGGSSGAAYFFQYDGVEWKQEQKMIPADGMPHDDFGYFIDMSGDVAILSAPFKEDIAPHGGAAYIFRFDGTYWVQEQKLLPDDCGDGDRFGMSVAVRNDIAVIGAPLHFHDGVPGGTAYLFRYDGSTWTQEEELRTIIDGSLSCFGESAVATANEVMVGATGNNAMFVFHATESDCNENGMCDSVDIADGTSQDCQPNGIPDECDVADGTSYDWDEDGIPDECECLGDIVEDGAVDVVDLLVLLGKWGPCPPEGECFGDLDYSGSVDVLDLLMLLGAWGPCP